MARPKNLTGVNKLCASCSRSCKQLACMDIVHCPRFDAEPTLKGIEAAAAKGLMIGRHPRACRQTGSPKNES